MLITLELHTPSKLTCGTCFYYRFIHLNIAFLANIAMHLVAITLCDSCMSSGLCAPAFGVQFNHSVTIYLCTQLQLVPDQLHLKSGNWIALHSNSFFPSTFTYVAHVFYMWLNCKAILTKVYGFAVRAA